MKTPNAHSENSKVCVSHKCCLHIKDITFLLDSFTKISILLAQCKSGMEILNDINLCKNISINLLSECNGMITRAKQLDSLKYDTILIYTLTNMINKTIELHNITQRLNENVYKCNDVQKIINEIYINTSILLIKYSSLLLYIMNKADSIDQSLIGRISSALASALFTSLLDIHNQQILDNLKKCIKLYEESKNISF